MVEMRRDGENGPMINSSINSDEIIVVIVVLVAVKKKRIAAIRRKLKWWLCLPRSMVTFYSIYLYSCLYTPDPVISKIFFLLARLIMTITMTTNPGDSTIKTKQKCSSHSTKSSPCRWEAGSPTEHAQGFFLLRCKEGRCKGVQCPGERGKKKKNQ